MNRAAIALACLVSVVSGTSVVGRAQTAPAPLAGAWIFVSPGRGTQVSSTDTRMKVYTDRTWYEIQRVTATGQVMFHHGGTYTLNGADDVETVAYANPSTDYRVGVKAAFIITIDGDTLRLVSGTTEEVWRRAAADVVATLGPEPAVERPIPIQFPAGFDGTTLTRACEQTPAGNTLAAQLGGSARGAPLNPNAQPISVRLLGLIEAQPQDTVRYVDLARCYYSQKHFEGAQRVAMKALDMVRRARQIAPPRPDAPKPLKQSGSAAPYPASAQQLGITGIVFVEATVDTDGSVRQARILGPVPGADDWALGAVQQWRFAPANVGGRAVESKTVLRLKFSPTTQLTPVDLIDVARFSYAQGDLAMAEDALGQATTMIESDIAEDRRWRACSANAIEYMNPAVTDVVWPVQTSGVRPASPKEGQAARLVILETVVDEHGDVSCAHVLRSASPQLDEAARTAIQEAKYQPATRGGTPIRVVMTLTISFAVQ